MTDLELPGSLSSLEILLTEGVDKVSLSDLEDKKLINILETCQKLIGTVPDRTYIDATEGGAKIAGTRVDVLTNVLSEYCTQPVDLSILKIGDSFSKV